MLGRFNDVGVVSLAIDVEYVWAGGKGRAVGWN
jgi:hypothetical protein